jgi:nicotinamidase-related amidase
VSAELRNLPMVDRRERSGVERAERCIPSRVPEAASQRSPYSLIFPPALELTVDPVRAALILVDVQHWTCDPETGLGRLAREAGRFETVAPFYGRVGAAVGNIRRLADACRSAGLLVVHVRTASHTPDGRDLAPKFRGYRFLPVPGSREADIVIDVAPQAGDIVLGKPASGVCTGTGLDELLRNAGVETVVLAGVSFDGAVEGSVRSLTDRGYGLVLVADACATFDERLQKGLWGMQTGIINVMSTEDLSRRIGAPRPAQAGRTGR